MAAEPTLLREILCVEVERVAGRDNTVAHNGRRLQLPASPVRAHYVKATVKVREYPDGTFAFPRGGASHRLLIDPSSCLAHRRRKYEMHGLIDEPRRGYRTARCRSFGIVLSRWERKPAALRHGRPCRLFSATGQLWGNPFYDCEANRRTGYAGVPIVCARFCTRGDHFRGFAAVWHVPAGAAAAQSSQWVPGPGADFFEVVQRELGCLPFIAKYLARLRLRPTRRVYWRSHSGGSGALIDAFIERRSYDSLALPSCF